MSNTFLALLTDCKRFRRTSRLCYGSTAGYALVLFSSLIVWSHLANTAQAQLFGERNVGRPLESPLGRGSGAASSPVAIAGPSAGLLDGSERFVRGNRSRREFVGSDRSEQSGFVGSTQAIGVGRVPAATEGLRIEADDMLRTNRPLPMQGAKEMYYPRLEVEFAVPPREISVSEVTDQQRLLERLEGVTGGKTELVIFARTAILRGSVPTQRVARLAEQLLSFEPGIDRIQNELQVTVP